MSPRGEAAIIEHYQNSAEAEICEGNVEEILEMCSE